MALILDLPWPSKNLSPNGRPHRMVKAASAKKARREARAVTSSHARQIGPITADALSFQATFSPPARYRYDDDNLMASIKAYRDGIADALGVDDRMFRTMPPVISEPVKGGNVRIEIKEIAA
ncbi:hypothetical protein JYP49_14195 [Nitratireductor aquimarinus]|uniref:hypothetical protein n=1 Tax=Nitratireductor TaxID=245876 RepID=UPI0019D32447|nr:MULTISPECIES: hypothetical protein [Nitratireductor]MBN7777748.1 hypothetical protein [Nitratireductor pacificus]MBN7781742.1 hypothetical protein [Nitratireductor pacificus]MBN7790548.1 hypothetical protein [Nitratireductor aquimarinus]MBY6099958.1 hypothetical protein [Nitratireductor aquimarinus]MCA1260424.1 hypothetical protein [Nitratireductor aquimarinus]